MDNSSASVTIDPATLTPTLSNTGVTKVYDGTTAAPTGFTPTYTFTGLVSGDTAATLSKSSATYDSTHAGQASLLTVSGLAITSIVGTPGSQASDYVLSATSKDVAATVTPATLTPTLSNTGVTKVYDGTTTAPAGFTPTYTFAGLVSGDTTAAISNSNAAYNNANVVQADKVVVSGLNLTGVTGNKGSLPSDYVLDASTKNVAARVTEKTVSLSASKVYDGTTALSNDQVTIGTGINNEGLMATGATVSDAHVATSGKFVSGITLADGAGGLASNYKLPASLDSSTAPVTINPAPLTAVASIGGSLTKTYDGTTAASGATVAGSVSGGIAGDVLNLNTSGISLAYNSAHVASANKVMASGSGTLTIASSSSNSAASDYSFTAPVVADATASITAKALTSTASIGGTLTKVYDGSTAAPSGATVTGNVDGAIAGDTLNLNTSGVSLAYNNAHVNGANALMASGPSTFTIASSGSGSQLSDYSLAQPSIANAVATITAKALTSTASIGGTLTKVYDGSTAAPSGATVTGNVDGAISGDTLNLNTSGVTLAYNSSHVNSANALLASGNSGFTIAASSNNSQASDYSLSQPTIANANASITAKALTSTASIGGTLTKVYDGSTAGPSAATVTGNVEGAIAGDTLNLNTAGVSLAYNSAHVTTANTLTASGTSTFTIASSSSGSQSGDYSLAQPSIASVAATITPKALTSTASIGGTLTKVYDGSSAAPVGATVTGGVDGAIAGDTLNLNTSGVSLAYNSARVATANALIASGNSTFTIGATSNSSELSDYNLSQPTIANASATITPKALTTTASIGGTLTKTFDGTTAASTATLTGSIEGAVAGDVLNLNTSGVRLAYNSAHVNTAQVAGATSIGAIGTPTLTIATTPAGSQPSDYSFTAPVISSVTAGVAITPRALTPTGRISGLLTKMYDGSTDALGATLTGSVTGAVSGDTFTFNTSALKFSYAFSQAGASNTISVNAPKDYLPTLNSPNKASFESDYVLSPFTIAPVPGAIIPVVTIVMPSIQASVAAAAPAASASSGSAPSGGDTGAQGGGGSSSGSGGSSGSSPDSADNAAQ